LHYSSNELITFLLHGGLEHIVVFDTVVFTITTLALLNHLGKWCRTIENQKGRTLNLERLNHIVNRVAEVLHGLVEDFLIGGRLKEFLVFGGELYLTSIPKGKLEGHMQKRVAVNQQMTEIDILLFHGKGHGFLVEFHITGIVPASTILGANQRGKLGDTHPFLLKRL